MDSEKILGRSVIEVSPADDGYPPLLKYIKDMPHKMYYTGNIYILKETCVAVVGSRHATDYGKWVAYALGKRLAECGVTVVSGMAAGIDSYAHKGALAAGGKTAAVLGCGLDICFPSSNKALMREIAEKGLLLSEYPTGIKPARYTFPQRNRIISGVSVATVVVEAGLGSGSLITAERAIEQGRDVYAVPGNIDSIYSIGTNKLIRDGATALCVIDDILSDLGIESHSAENERGLGRDERAVMAVVRGGGEVTIDKICKATYMTPGKVSGIVTVLEMKGMLCTELGKIFIAKI